MSSAGDAWYSSARSEFLGASGDAVVGCLASAAARGGWLVEPDQHTEWRSSVDHLQSGLRNPGAEELRLLQEALRAPELAAFSHVVLEYNMRRRGLRLDCVLLAPGLVVVLEFKRSQIAAADRDQVVQYCANLFEFHEETRRLCQTAGVVLVPVLALTEGAIGRTRRVPAGWHPDPWSSIARHPLECDGSRLRETLREALSLRESMNPVSAESWLGSRFSPSSTIVDAAIAMYGRHDVSAIQSHAVPADQIKRCTAEVAQHIAAARTSRRNRLILVSGTPGAGKTLVGLDLTFHPDFRGSAVYVTGNAPLVDVLRASLKGSYKQRRRRTAGSLPAGYALTVAPEVVEDAATYPIVKAHEFLGERGSLTASVDGSIVIFDEAQRTYEKDRRVLGHALPDHEADLVLASLEKSYPAGAVVVALLGHNQAINRGERGAVAWLEAADRHGWEFSVADETLLLGELASRGSWATHSLRRHLQHGHLAHSMRFYRSMAAEKWAHEVLEDHPFEARRLASELDREGHTIWLTRELQTAREWARAQRVGEERVGVIASGQARRLAAEGLYVELKPPIDKWMLTPTGDPRSSNMLETVQNTYQIQGLELDYSVVGWDVDLRRGATGWASFKLNGARWERDKALDVAKNGYRVLLTRARKGMIIFVPQGDKTGDDEATRNSAWYDEIATFLQHCGAKLIGAPDVTQSD